MWCAAHAVVGNYAVVGASAAGHLHLARGRPRDDAFVVRSCGNWIAVAVADGLGSRRLSRYGATLAVEILAATMLASLPDDAITAPPPVVSSRGVAPPPWPRDPALAAHVAGTVGTTSWHSPPPLIAVGDVEPEAGTPAVDEPEILTAAPGDVEMEPSEPAASEGASRATAPALRPWSRWGRPRFGILLPSNLLRRPKSEAVLPSRTAPQLEANVDPTQVAADPQADATTVRGASVADAAGSMLAEPPNNVPDPDGSGYDSGSPLRFLSDAGAGLSEAPPTASSHGIPEVEWANTDESAVTPAVRGAPAPSSAAHAPTTAVAGAAATSDAGTIDPQVLEGIVRRAFVETRTAVARRAGDLGVEPADLGCTLLGVLIDTTTGISAHGQVGDGAIVGSNGAGLAGPLVDVPWSSDPNEVCPLVHPRWESFFNVRVIPAEYAPSLIFVMTDGVANDCLPGVSEAELGAWIARLGDDIRSGPPASGAARLLRWIASYQRPDSFDDRTIVGIYR
jgi:hypothetical protein